MPGLAATAITSDSILQRIDRILPSFGKTNLVTAILLIQGLLIYVDYLSGPWLPFGVFYLATLYLVVKYLGGRAAYVIAFIVVCGKTYVRLKTLPMEFIWWQGLWQFISSYSIYSFFCYLINNQLKARRHAESIAALATNRAGEAERKLLNISEETQQRIGRELHDDLGQHITGIAFMAQVLSQKLKADGREEQTDAERITLMLNQAISKTRNIAHGLYPSELEEHGLKNMLEKFVDHVEATYHINCSFSSDNNCEIDDHEVAIHLLRITQEAVSNAVKHGRATRIILRISCFPSSQVLEIWDNGCGLGVGIMSPVMGLGMRSMRYRAEMIGASLEILSRPEGGTQVKISVPVKR